MTDRFVGGPCPSGLYSSKKNPATTYSPTQLPRQYQRSCDLSKMLGKNRTGFYQLPDADDLKNLADCRFGIEGRHGLRNIS
jgi:hypothetical protein